MRWILYIIFTILMSIVMLNLLISIISDEYDRVQSTQRSTDLKAKCEMIYDFGQLEIFFRRNILRQPYVEGETLYVHRFRQAKAAGFDENAGQWVGRVKVMTEKQQKIQDDLTDLRKNLDKKMDRLYDDLMAKMDSRMDTMEKQIERVNEMVFKQVRAEALKKMQAKMDGQFASKLGAQLKIN